MDIIRLSVERPTAIFSLTAIIAMMGAIALWSIPIQLSPDVRKPILSVETTWRGASPTEIEREIIIPQEDKLRGIQGIERMLSKSYDGRGEIELTFSVGQNMEEAVLMVSNRLDQVERYPDEADRPTIDSAGSEDSPIAWLILKRLEGNDTPIHRYGDFANDFIKERLERIKGIAKSNVYGGSEREIRVIIDARSMAAYRLTVPDILNKLRADNISVSAGDVEEGKRRYIVRSEGELNSVGRVRQVVLKSRRDSQTGRIAHVTVADIAEVREDWKEPQVNIRALGYEAIAVNAIRTTGSNVIETMEQVRNAVADMNQTILPQEGLVLTQVYDETVYIDSAINLVVQNIWVGGFLAAVVMLLFLKSGLATLIASMAIPVSIISTFVAMSMMGRSLNVISLAGIAFAVGMVVDATIVVLENIFRIREQGDTSGDGAHRATQQVWPAIFVSALTTVIVFIPILFMDLEVGQLFRDIAVAICVAVMMSLLVAITLIPALSQVMLDKRKTIGSARVTFLDRWGRRIGDVIEMLVAKIINSRRWALRFTAALTLIAFAVFWLLLPKLEYLPEGNRNLVFGVLLPPPGYNLETVTDIGKKVENHIRPFLVDPRHPLGASDRDVPPINNFFFVSTAARTFLGASSTDPARVKELIPVLAQPAFEEPGTFGFISQPSLFGRGIGSGRTIDLDISGPDLPTIFAIGTEAAGRILAVMPTRQGTQLRPQPGLELGSPEIEVVPDLGALADIDMSARALSESIRAFNYGIRVAEVTSLGQRIDLTLRGPEQYVRETQGIAELPVVTPQGMIVPVSSLADVHLSAGPVQIRRLEKTRTVTLEIRPSPDIPLEEAISILRDKVVTPLRQNYADTGVTVDLSGTADELTKTWNAIVADLSVAIVIVYLVMAILFNSFAYPLIIMLSVPVAMAGGVIALSMMNALTRQPLDMLTLLGFIILTGIVVNNAILLVHRALQNVRERHMAIDQAVCDSVHNRLRPIFMSTLTSLFGMLPLVIFPGAGSELYRGLGSVVLGGLALSSILTLLMVPPMLSILMPWIEPKTVPRHKQSKTKPELMHRPSGAKSAPASNGDAP